MAVLNSPGKGLFDGAISFALRLHLDVKNGIEKNWKLKPYGYFLIIPYLGHLPLALDKWGVRDNKKVCCEAALSSRLP